jgi:acyl carrier protein
MPKHRSTATGRRDGLTGDDTFNRIQSIIAADLEIAPSKVMLPTSFIDDLHTDSLDMIELIMAFEDAFDFMIPGIAVETIDTEQDAVHYISSSRRSRSVQTCRVRSAPRRVLDILHSRSAWG